MATVGQKGVVHLRTDPSFNQVEKGSLIITGNSLANQGTYGPPSGDHRVPVTATAAAVALAVAEIFAFISCSYM